MALDSEEGKQKLLERLGKEPFPRLAGELGLGERELVDYLLSLGDARAEPDDQPWWPEALARLHRGVPIRDVAWIFRQPSASVRRAIERAGLDTARVGADEIAVARATGDAPPPSAETNRPLIELPAIDAALEALPDPEWSSWAPIDSVVEPQGARPVAEARAIPVDQDFPPEAEAPLEDPAESFGWRTVPAVDAAFDGGEDEPSIRRMPRSGNVRLVRPEEERAPPAPAPAPAPPVRERKRPRVAASPVRMRSADEVDLSELVMAPRPSMSRVAAPVPRASPRPVRTEVRTSRFAWEVQLGSGRTVVVTADDAVSAVARVADFATSSELVGATLRRVTLAG
jgi:hypothetical protein